MCAALCNVHHLRELTSQAEEEGEPWALLLRQLLEQMRQAVQAAKPPGRVILLGTNHFGRSSSVVATDKDFQTPWGVLENDRAFLRRLQTLEEMARDRLAPGRSEHLALASPTC